MSELRSELARLTLELCRIPSETLHEAVIADWVEHRCRAELGEVGVHRVGNSVVCAPPEADPSLPTVALVGHLDTVRCAVDQPAEIRDGRVYGCGASDMKSGLAVMISLLERRQSLRTARPVWIFYDGEEGPAELNGLEPVLQSGLLPDLDLAFVLEPTDRSLQMGCMGTLHAVVTVRGQRAHSARPWQGRNAILESIPLLQRFQQLQRRPVHIGELVYYEVMVPTQVWTENSKNVVPERLMLNINVRFAPGRTAQDAENHLRELVGDAGEVEVIDHAPAGDVYLNHPLVEPWRSRREIPIACKQAWTDVARFTERGIPAVNFGPGETSQAHQASEWCSIDSLEFTYSALWSYFTE
jgi:succinyl-diaminopimelate desuccinylase